jgi:hypothetical protein
VVQASGTRHLVSHDEPTEAEDVDIRHIKPRLLSFVGRNANRFAHGVVAHVALNVRLNDLAL